MTRTRPPISPPGICLPALAPCPGCFESAGKGGPGDIVVPREKLQQINNFDPAAASRPSSRPGAASRPSTAPAQVQLTIEECRRFALQNNLDLRVELLNPTIARESLSAEEARFEALFVANA